MSNYGVSEETQLRETKFQLTQLAYDQFRITAAIHGMDIDSNFRELASGVKSAWIDGVWAAVEASKSKNIIYDKRAKKELDIGYLLFAGAKEITKNNPGIYTYSKFPEKVKEKYRELAVKVHHAIELDEEYKNEA